MSAPIPSLPQSDSPQQQQQRLAELQQQRQLYTYSFSSNLAPLGVAAQVPPHEGFSLVWMDGVATTALQLLGNVLAIASKAVEGLGDTHPNEASLSVVERQKAHAVYQDLVKSFHRLSEKTTRVHQSASAVPPVAPRANTPAHSQTLIESVTHRLESAVGAVEEAVGVVRIAAGAVANELKSPASLDAPSIVDDVLKCIEEILEILLSDAFHALLKLVGLYGQADSLEQFTAQFALLLVPSVISNYEDDIVFARMRLAGPNPVVIQAIETLPANFPVTDAQFQSVMGRDDSLAQAGAQGRLFLADYKILEGVTPGESSGKKKYLSAPLALFAVPAATLSDRRLRAIAIQCGQTPGASNPIFTPQDGASWHLARLQVQVADGNYHELISHLGLTHLVLEQFAMATPRHLPVQHPLYLLLTPHFQGTLAINDAANAHLVAKGGAVDTLLSGTIQSSIALSVQAVLNQSIHQSFLPNALRARGVDDVNALPDYPYRDDALLLWNDIHSWVNGYLALYYKSDDSLVQGDYELQHWIKELASPEGGKLKDIEENGQGIQTFAYLVDLVTYAIFTASVQHATVNFPQRTIMSFTPAMPLAAYTPAPTSVDKDLSQREAMKSLPPLQSALTQLLFGFGLGNVYFTRLGGYDTYRLSPWFSDPSVMPLLETFQNNLRKTEQEIGRRNLSRIPYETLVPSAIPQSINI